MANVSDVLILGGGIIGMSTAYACAAAGLSVTVLEAETVASGSSGAAAGMLAPQVEAQQRDAFFELCLQGRAVHRKLAEILYDEIGVDVEYRQTGVLRVALEDREAVDLRGRQQWQVENGLHAEWIEPHELPSIEPLFHGAARWQIAGALYLPDEAQVRSPRLVRALASAVQRRGGIIHEGASVTHLLRAGDRVTGAESTVGSFSAATTILAAGVWSGEIAATLGVHLPLQPIKGQIIAVDSILQQPQHILWSGECYITPKADSQTIIGSTEEHAGYDRRPTLAGVFQLAEGATHLLPQFGKLPIANMWAGLRPALPDRFPAIGPIPGLEGLIIATGHFRNGILLGPLTGQIVADLVRGIPSQWDIAPFSTERLLPHAM